MEWGDWLTHYFYFAGVQICSKEGGKSIKEICPEMVFVTRSISGTGEFLTGAQNKLYQGIS
jgi:hypothetical protein